MGRNTSSIELTNADREYLQLQTRTRTIQIAKLLTEQE